MIRTHDRRRVIVAVLAAAGCASVASAQYTLVRVGNIAAPSGGAEISAFDRWNSRVYSTHSGGLDYFKFTAGALSVGGTINMTGLLPAVGGISSVSIDPLGRGFGIASVIPDPNDGSAGILALFDTSTNTVVKTLPVGFNPDMVTFSPDGKRALIANEGEPNTTDPAGGISIVDLSGVNNAGDLAGLGAGNVSTVGFAPGDLGPGVSLAGVRINPANAGKPTNDPEPEYIAADNDGAWVSLQEGNALARFDFGSGKWSAINPLGSIVQRIDASDKDGGAFIDDFVAGLPMPDAIASYTAGGSRYIVSANEGDARPFDETRFKDANIDATVLATLNGLYGGNAKADAALGRLTLTNIDGDTDMDGDIDVPTMFGTRSFSIWDENGALVFDSGSFIEEQTLLEVPGLFNSDGTAGSFDTRSDNKGPEPEAVELGVIGGRTFAFIGLERVGGVMMFDVTDPLSVAYVDYLNTGTLADGGLAPEGLDFFEVDGEYFLAVSYEVTGSVEIFQIVPAPGTMALAGLAGALMVRRRRA